MAAPRPNPEIPLDVLREDARFVVLAKPPGITSEPGLGHRTDTLMNGVFARWGDRLAPLGEARDHGLVHRLDRDASGALLVALDAAAYDALRGQFEARTVRKRYLALVDGQPPRPEGRIDLPLDEVRRGDMKVSVPCPRGGGKPATTRWRTLGATRRRALLEVEIETGRLHQIRAHLAHLGCPVSGDPVYRVDLPPNTSAAKGRGAAPLALHAWTLGFRHPGDGSEIVVACPAPAGFAATVREAGFALPASPA